MKKLMAKLEKYMSLKADLKKNQEKGVHPSSYSNEKDQGRSEAGDSTRQSSKMRAGNMKNKMQTAVKDGHKKVLSEMKAMPKPNLPKSEGMEKGDKRIKSKITPTAVSHFEHATGVHGFHRPNDPGTSTAGMQIKTNASMMTSPKDKHARKLNELKDMPKPNLPKSEDMEKADPKTHLPGMLLDKVDQWSEGIGAKAAAYIKQCAQRQSWDNSPTVATGEGMEKTNNYEQKEQK